MLTGPKSVVSRSVKPSLVFNTPLRTTEACCEPGSEGCVCLVGAGSLASPAKTGGASRTPEKRSASSGSSAVRRAMERSLLCKRIFIVERKFLAVWPVIVLRAGQSAARQRRCATAHSGWDHGVATVAARVQRVPAIGLLRDVLGLSAAPAPAPTHRHRHGAMNRQA